MTAVDQAFDQFDTSLNLALGERTKAELRHNYVRDVLEAAGIIVGSFLQGSFARKTMLKPLKDVDIVCLLPETKRSDFTGPGGAARALESFKEPIGSKWPTAKFDSGEEPAGKALRVEFDDVDFTIDLVAAFEVPGDTEDVIIADREADEWVVAKSRTLNRLIRERNQECGGRFIHQVRMAKTLKHTHEDLDHFKGIVIESVAYEAVKTSMTHQEALAAIVKAAADLLRGPLMDPTGEGDVTAKWSYAERQRAVEKLGELSQRAEEALSLEAGGDEHGAQDVWGSVLGEDFPKPPARTPAEVLGTWHVGSTTSTGRPSSSDAGRHSPAPTRPWRSM